MKETQEILKQMGFKNPNGNVWKSDWFVAFVPTRLFYFERTQSSVDWCFWCCKIKRREPVQDEEKRGKYKDVAVIDYRRSFMKGYAYITISFFHYFTLNIDLHRPL